VSAVIGGLGTRPGSFRGLRGLAVSPRGELVCTERGNARVQRLTAGGRALASWPIDVKPGRALLPAAIDDSARVAVADEATGRLWMFDARGGLLARTEGLAGPRALAFASDGTLLVAEARGGIVRRWRLTAARAPGSGAEH
jgi:sugar lactone lactonase YvrE